MALIDNITEQVIKVPLTETTKEGVLKELLQLLTATGKVQDETAALNALLERESRGSTGLENGVAIPHAKTDAVAGVLVAIGIAPQGIDFEAHDGQPSKAFFLILAPSDQSSAHIEALSEIARMTRSAAFLRTLIGSENPEEVVELIRD